MHCIDKNKACIFAGMLALGCVFGSLESLDVFADEIQPMNDNAVIDSSVNSDLEDNLTNDDTIQSEIDVIADGWTQDRNSYYLNGKLVVGFLDIEGETYYFDVNGIKATGLTLVNDDHYYFDLNTGKRLTGFQTIEVNGVSQLSYFDLLDGKMYLGFHNIEGKTYYFDELGASKIGFVQYNGKTYYLDQNGVIATGLVKINDKYSEC